MSAKRRPQRRATRVAQQAKDILAKWLAQQMPTTFLSALGLDLPPIVEVLPTEVPVLSVHLEHPDVLVRLADASIADLEFQMTGEPDLWRFLQYNCAAVLHYQSRVHTVVIYGPGIATAPQELDLGSLRFRVTNLFIGQQEAEEVLATLEAKRARGESLDAGDRTRLVLLPLMKHRQALPEVLRTAVGLLEGVEATEMQRTVGAMVGMAYNYVSAEQAGALLEVLKMANALEELVIETLTKGIEQGRAEGVEQGRAEGVEQGRAEALVSFRRIVAHAVMERFGQVPAGLNLEQAGEVQLEEILRRLVHAERPEDLL